MEPIPVVLCDDEIRIIDLWEDFLSVEPRIKIIGKFLTSEEYRMNIRYLNPKVAILDVWFNMEPEGYDLLKWTKENTDIKVIMTSVDRYEIPKLKALGADSFLFKSDQESIVSKILELIE